MEFFFGVALASRELSGILFLALPLPDLPKHNASFNFFDAKAQKLRKCPARNVKTRFHIRKVSVFIHFVKCTYKKLLYRTISLMRNLLTSSSWHIDYISFLRESANNGKMPGSKLIIWNYFSADS